MDFSVHPITVKGTALDILNMAYEFDPEHRWVVTQHDVELDNSVTTSSVKYEYDPDGRPIMKQVETTLTKKSQNDVNLIRTDFLAYDYRCDDSVFRPESYGLPPIQSPGAATMSPAIWWIAGAVLLILIGFYFRRRAAGLTSYLGVSGKNNKDHGGVLLFNKQIRLADIVDGTSNTLLCGERPPSPDFNFGWWYTGAGQDGTGNADLILGSRETLSEHPANRIRNDYRCDILESHYSKGELRNPCDVLHFWSLHHGGANFALVDGSVQFMPYESHSVLESMSVRNDGEKTLGGFSQ